VKDVQRSPAFLLMLCTFLARAFAGDAPAVIKHLTVYHEAGRFGGWPANHGIWAWGDEVVVGFSAAYFQWTGEDRHPYDRSKPEEPRLARSLDGGETWKIETPANLTPPEGMFTGPNAGGAAKDLSEPLDFTAPGFAMTLRMTDAQQGRSWLFYSYDRAKTWSGPFNFPMLGQTAINARTDYIVNGKRDAMVFLTAAKASGREGRPLCARTRDGGLHWEFVSWIAPDPGEGFSIMPSSVRLPGNGLVTAVRHEDSLRHGPNWIDAYLSKDDGRSWHYLSRPAPDTGDKSGNPPSMIRLRDGRLALTYGRRAQPFRILARLSIDNGRTWSGETILRDHGGAWDIGYTRTAQRRDGKIVTVYYWVDDPKKERVIEATIWDPGGLK
jgi:hypothetical protein